METKSKNIGTYPQQFEKYIKLVGNKDLKTFLNTQLKETEYFFHSIHADKYLYRYAEGKWTIKEVIQHIIDSERIFNYRALAISRKEVSTLPSFDEENYAANSNAENREWKDLVDEFAAIRKSTIFLFDSFSGDQLQRSGKASNYEISVDALGYLIAGHVAHHVNILKERYGV